nr:MAG TPA: hypothetical protein [Caudoviricetes sp.]
MSAWFLVGTWLLAIELQRIIREFLRFRGHHIR